MDGMSELQAIFAKPVVRAVVFSLASNAAVIFVLKFGQIMWPQGAAPPALPSLK
jgi:hypothetical protein